MECVPAVRHLRTHPSAILFDPIQNHSSRKGKTPSIRPSAYQRPPFLPLWTDGGVRPSSLAAILSRPSHSPSAKARQDAAPPQSGVRLQKTLAFSLVFRFPSALRAGRPRPGTPSASLPLFNVREAVFKVFNADIPPVSQPSKSAQRHSRHSSSPPVPVLEAVFSPFL